MGIKTEIRIGIKTLPKGIGWRVGGGDGWGKNGDNCTWTTTKKDLIKKKKDTMTELQVYIDRQCVPKEQW